MQQRFLLMMRRFCAFLSLLPANSRDQFQCIVDSGPDRFAAAGLFISTHATGSGNKRVGDSIRIWRTDRSSKVRPKGYLESSSDVWVKTEDIHSLTNQATRNSQGTQGVPIAEDWRKQYTSTAPYFSVAYSLLRGLLCRAF